MALQRIPVYELQVGMYVAKLDLSWFRSPFLRHSFLIERPAQIERLVRAGVKTVEIDLDRGIGVVPDEAVLPFSAAPESPGGRMSSTPSKQVKPLAQLNEEYAQAKIAKKQLDETVHSFFSSITKTGAVPPDRAAQAVQEITIVARTLSNSALFMAFSQTRAGDDSLSRHALATSALTLVLGQSFQFNPLELQELATAALLHDIGLLEIPPALIRRAHVTSPPLSYEERRHFRAHPGLGARALERQGAFEMPVLYLIEHHHSPPPGSGILPPTVTASLSNRTGILRLVDKYDELITGFGGASPFAPRHALQRLYIEAQQGGFDQKVLAQFIHIVGIYPVHSCVRLNTNELAVVTALNPEKLHQPIVTVTHKPGGAECRPPFAVDLANQEGQERVRSIESVLDTPPGSFASDPPQAA